MRRNCLKWPLRSKFVGIWAMAFAELTLLGCSGREYSLVNVSGTVTMDNQPLAGASVTFAPVGDGVGPASAARTDESGHYVLQTIDLDLPGAVPGSHRITITTARAADAADERATISKEHVPAQYRDGSYRFEVSAEGTQAADIEIRSKGK